MTFLRFDWPKFNYGDLRAVARRGRIGSAANFSAHLDTVSFSGLIPASFSTSKLYGTVGTRGYGPSKVGV